MSQQPHQLPTHSSLPSKSSSRRTTSGGGGTNSSPQPQQQLPASTTPATRSLLPSPHFEDDPIVSSHQPPAPPSRPNLTLRNPEYSEHAVAESETCSHGATSVSVHPLAGEPTAIPSFQPFFTLIEDSVTNEHYHPTVHYIFADDDADIIAEAALRSLESLDPAQRVGGSTTAREDVHGLNTSRLPPSIAGTREHYLILDVHPQFQPQPEDPASATTAAPGSYSYTVSSFQSLSAEWQVLRTNISAAPTIGDNPNPSAEDEGLMLRIEGRGNTPGDNLGPEKGKEKSKEADGNERETMEEMIERFRRRLEDIRSVMDAGSRGLGGDPFGRRES